MQVPAGLCLLVIATTLATAAFATTAHAANYRMVLCAANNGSNSFDTATNTTSPQNPGGIFSFENYCGPAPYPAGNSAFLRIAENQASGNAGVNAYGSISWTVPPWVAILAGGGYTREPGNFNDGWRGRFWAEGWDGSTNNILMQGSGVDNGSLGGIGWATCGTFCSHLWPFDGYGSYRRFVFELTCMRPSGCDRSGWNAVDANTMVLTLADTSPASVGFSGGPLLSGQWTRGSQGFTWNSADQGSGLRFERLRLDGAQISLNDYRGQCDIDSNGGVGEFARQFAPCPTGGPWGHAYTLETAGLPDGAHTIQTCASDYAQAAGLDNTGSESCDNRTIHTDNTPPGKPAALAIRSANPARYLDHFGATFSLPPDPGSPIAKIHYLILGAKGEVVVPEQVVGGTNPTALADIQGPAKPGAYTLKLWLEDSVGFQGPAAEVAVPHDTTPPAAPQELHVGGSGTRWLDKVDLRWTNIVDDGSPIDTAHYEVVDASGAPLDGGAHTVEAEGVQAINGLATPSQRGNYKLRVWLADEEGNVGAASSAPLPIDTTPPAAPQGLSVAAPSTPRSAEGFDLRWRDIADDGSPIDAAHYQLLNGSGAVVVPTQTVEAENVESIQDLQTPQQRGNYTLKMWLSDAEGNVGAPTTAPLAYECMRTDASGGTALTSGLGEHGAAEETVKQGAGATLRGKLAGAGGGVGEAPLCVFSRVLTDQKREFLGVAVSGPDGGYQFAIPAGASRDLSVLYRSGSREVSSQATIQTIVRPSFTARKKVVHNKHWARFYGEIPGPDNNRVVVVLQAKVGKGKWLAFRRYRTRDGGRFSLRYRFHRTTRPTTYVMRAQVRAQNGYPYLQGNSRPLALRVLP